MDMFVHILSSSLLMDSLRKLWTAEETAFFQGWNFSHLRGRWDNEEITWDFSDVVRSRLKSTHTLLDMGTGGGEFLLSFGHPHNQTCVTEGYPPNAELCEKTLAPLGIRVKQIFDDSQIPYNDALFDVVMNRHEAFEAKEVFRVLKPGGVFITQQVGGENDKELRETLCPGEINPFSLHNLKNNISILEQAGFEILFQDECFPKSRFFDIGAIVYFAKIIEWEFPGFSVDRCFNQLCRLHEEIVEQGFVETTEHRFIIAAQKSSQV